MPGNGLNPSGLLRGHPPPYGEAFLAGFARACPA